MIADEHPPYHDTDAGGSCRLPGCTFNSDIDHYERIERGEDVYGPVPEGDMTALHEDED